MKVANPIYDSVFKYLLDDHEVAKVLLSHILDMKIESLQLQPTEVTLPSVTRDFTVFRVDFKATITLESHEQQVILIEIQKAKLDSDIMRFRKYLGSQYLDENNSYENNPNKALPIYTIYFLGHELSHSPTSPIINVTREYIDNYSKEKLTQKEEFIECLTHNSIVVQIPLFKRYRRNSLERLLSIFEASTRHEVDAEDYDDADYRLITNRLIYANSDEKIRQQMDIEDEILRELDSKDRSIAGLILEKEEALAREEEALVREEEALARESKEKTAKEEAIASLKKIISKLLQKGFSLAEVAESMDKPVAEIEALRG